MPSNPVKNGWRLTYPVGGAAVPVDPVVVRAPYHLLVGRAALHEEADRIQKIQDLVNISARLCGRSARVQQARRPGADPIGDGHDQTRRARQRRSTLAPVVADPTADPRDPRDALGLRRMADREGRASRRASQRTQGAQPARTGRVADPTARAAQPGTPGRHERYRPMTAAFAVSEQPATGWLATPRGLPAACQLRRTVFVFGVARPV